VQGDADGTLLSFTNGTASTKLVTGVMTIGGAIVSNTSATTVTPATTASTPLTTTTTKAKIYLGSNDNFTVNNSGATVYGNSGYEIITIAVGISGVTLDQNIERINFSGTSSAYAFKQTGNKINIYNTSGSTLIATAPVQGDTDGTIIGFSNGNASALLSAGVMTVGGATVSSTAAGAIVPVLK
jgi:hypothetical protein